MKKTAYIILGLLLVALIAGCSQKAPSGGIDTQAGNNDVTPNDNTASSVNNQNVADESAKDILDENQDVDVGDVI